MRRAPRGEPYTVQGSNYYTYCHVKKILDEFVETLPSIVQAYYGTYDEAHDVECLKSGSGGSVVYADSSTITDHDDLFMETGIGGITVAGLTYTPSSNVGASLYFSEAVKKTLQHNTETGSAAVLADYHSFGLEGIAERETWPRVGEAPANGHDSGDVDLRHLGRGRRAHSHGFSSRALREDYPGHPRRSQAIMEDLARAVDGTTSYTDVSGNALASRGYSNDQKTNYWDHAFAKFIGTENARGKTIYARANKRGANYGQNDNNGVSVAAKSIICLLIDGQATRCGSPPSSDIEHTIQVIYAQATLRYAYLVDRDLADGRAYKEHRAAGLAFYNTISAWVKNEPRLANVRRRQMPKTRRNLFDVNTVPEWYNYYSFCAVKKVMVAFLGSSASQMGTLENTGDIGCAAASSTSNGDAADSDSEAEQAEDEDAGAAPSPPEPPPGPVILVDDEYAGARRRGRCAVSAIVVSLVVALWA